MNSIKRVFWVILFLIIIISSYKAYHSALELPNHYVIPVFLSLGLWTWALNIHGLTLAEIDISSLFQYDYSAYFVNKEVNHQEFIIGRYYRVAITYSIIVSPILLSSSHLDGWIVALVYGLVLFVTVLPFSTLCHKERFRFLGSFYRIAFGGIKSPVAFGDVILADILTSFSQIFGDLHLLTVLIVDPNTIATKITVFSSGKQFQQLVAFSFTVLPYLFRLRQCIAEYCNNQNKSNRSRHLFNALKYFSAVPSLASAYFIKYFLISNYSDNHAFSIEVSKSLQEAVLSWTIFATINTSYSLYWDIFIDWDLGYTEQRTTQHRFLRPILFYEKPLYYYLAVMFDTGCRASWVANLYKFNQLVNESDPMHQSEIRSNLKILSFTFKILEIVRRAVWVFFRVEREWVHTRLYSSLKTESTRHHDDALNTEDIPLRDHQMVSVNDHTKRLSQQNNDK